MFVATVLAVLSILILACGGDSEATPADTSVPVVTSTPAAIPMTPSVTDISSSSGADELAIEVKEILLEPGEYGGKLTLTIFNPSDEECYGPVVNFAFLREDKSVAGNMGLADGDSMVPGEEHVLNQRYVGIGVVEAQITSMGCDNAGLSADSGSGAREAERK